MADAKVQDTRIISADETYHGWPTVARRKNGELMVVASAGRKGHVCPFGQVQLQRSTDNGETWSAPEVLVDGPLDDRDAGILELPDGTLLVCWFTSLAWMNVLCRHEVGASNWLTAEDLRQWRDERERVIRQVDVAAVHGLFVIRSTDDGASWSDPIRCPANSPHGPTLLADGSLLYLGKKHNPDQQAWAGGATHGSTPIIAAHSGDGGLTWSEIGEVPFAAGHSGADYHEPHAVQAADGRIVVLIRNHGEPHARETLQSESFDQGKTWSIPHAVGFSWFALPPHLLRLADGRLLATCGYRDKPYGNLAWVSDNHGESWSGPLVISADGTSMDLGYPSTVELEPGKLLTVWYENMSDRQNAVLRQARWSLS